MPFPKTPPPPRLDALSRSMASSNEVCIRSISALRSGATCAASRADCALRASSMLPPLLRRAFMAEAASAPTAVTSSPITSNRIVVIGIP